MADFPRAEPGMGEFPVAGGAGDDGPLTGFRAIGATPREGGEPAGSVAAARHGDGCDVKRRGDVSARLGLIKARVPFLPIEPV